MGDSSGTLSQREENTQNLVLQLKGKNYYGYTLIYVRVKLLWL